MEKPEYLLHKTLYFIPDNILIFCGNSVENNGKELKCSLITMFTYNDLYCGYSNILENFSVKKKGLCYSYDKIKISIIRLHHLFFVINI